MASQGRLGASFVCLVLFASVIPALADVDHPCIEPLMFPPNCVQQLGPIGGPPQSSSDEGYRGIVSPIVDPLLRLEATDERSGRIYAIHPGSNTVRVFASDAAEVLADIKGCYRPSALAQDVDGARVFVSCHASNAVGVIDTESNLMTGMIQDRDELGRPRMQEPMGLVYRGGLLYAASSQNNRIAVIDPAGESVLRYIEIPGQEPRDMVLAGNGEFLIVANFLAGNRTEPARPVPPNQSEECEELLEDPAALAVFSEDHPNFMDTSHPDYPTIADCYFAAHGGPTDTVVRNPARPDHDLVVVRLSDEQVVFTTNSLLEDPGTLNYGLAVSGTRVYLATVHARNDLGTEFGNRPLVNRLVVLDLDPASGELKLGANGIQDLDAPFLDDFGVGAAQGATPYAIAAEGQRVLVAAAGSDNLVVTDTNGVITEIIETGFGPKGVVAAGDTAWVYNANGLSLSKVDLRGSVSLETGDLGPSPVPQTARLGARLFDSAQFASNGTFACASCHPDGHLDGLLWELNGQDGLRATMSVRQISENAPFHWDGSMCNLLKIIQDGVVNLFGSPAPTACESKVMIDFIEGLVHPRTPFRPIDDSLTREAALGSAVLHRAAFKDGQLELVKCNNRMQDMTVETAILEAAGDPQNEVFRFKETCGTNGCHMAPHLGTGRRAEGSFAATFLLGLWDRPITLHDARTTRAKHIEAIEINRQYYGADPIDEGEHFSGEVATLGFQSARFSHRELNTDKLSSTHGFVISDATGRYMLEAQELQSGAVGLTFALRTDTVDDLGLVDLLESSADQRKIALRGIGTLGGQLLGLTWNPDSSRYLTDEGGSLTRTELIAALAPGDSMVLYGALPPGQGASPDPKLKTLRRAGSPYECSEGYNIYPAAVETGETGATITIVGTHIVSGSRVLVDGQVTGAPLGGFGSPFSWTLPEAPSTAGLLSIQILAPNGMLSNTLPLPVVEPVVPPHAVESVVAARSESDFALSWESQFGITGPGTQYDVHRGRLSQLRSGDYGGLCLMIEPDATKARQSDAVTPQPGEGFYYVVRAENQAGITSWGSAVRDTQIQSCIPRFD